MIKKLSKSIGKYKLFTILTPILVSIEVVFDVIIPLIMADIIDNGIKVNNLNYIIGKGILLIGISILALACGVGSGITASRSSSGFMKNLRKNMFDKIQDFSFANIDKFSTASLVTRLTTDVNYVGNAFQMLTRIAIRCPLMLAFSLIMTFRINTKIALIFLFTIPYLGIGLFLIISKVHPLMNKTLKTYDKLNNVVEENVSGIKTIKSYVLEDFERFKFNTVSDKIYNYFSKAEKLLALNNPLLQSAVYISMLLISWIGAKIIVTSHEAILTTGELTTLFTYTMLILTSLMMVSMVLVMVIISKSAAVRICEVLDEVPSIKNNDNPIYEIKNGSVDFTNVGFSYINKLDKEVLKNININIKSGEFVGIIGGTGSSKTSLVNLIPRLYDITEGSLKVGGVEVCDYDIKTLRDNVACVLQKNLLFTGTIEENIKWGNMDATHEDVVKVSKLAQCDSFINTFENGYYTLISENGNNVSGGQKQRICIARALLKKPKILILDDSTSAVDTKTDSLIRKAFKEEIPDTTKIIIAQRIASIIDCDRIIVLSDGEINGIGTHKELLKNNSIYKEVYESQMKGSDSND